MDLFSYWLAFAAVRMSQHKSNARETFGAHRAEIISAFVSGIVLLLVVGFIYFEAGQRLYRISRGQAIGLDYTFMVTVPWLSVVANWYLLRRFHGAHDINIRGAHLHVWSDFVSALGVIIAGVLILATGNAIFDPLVSIFIGFLILVGALELIRDSLNILLERTPAHIDVDEIVLRVRSVPGVSGVHSVHVWSLCSTVHAMSAHVVAAPEAVGDTQRLLEATRERIARDFSIDFTTFQVECQDCGAGDYQTAAHTAPAAHGHAHT
jgi:cobalt-zinc-cadmium efflux system protein